MVAIKLCKVQIVHYWCAFSNLLNKTGWQNTLQIVSALRLWTNNLILCGSHPGRQFFLSHIFTEFPIFNNDCNFIFCHFSCGCHFSRGKTQTLSEFYILIVLIFGPLSKERMKKKILKRLVHVEVQVIG